jgi:hypothetical protein
MRRLSMGKSRHGYILLPVVLLLAMLALVAFLLGYEGGIGRYLTLQRAEPEKAFYAAEAGLQMATWQVQQANCVNYGDIPATPFGNGSFSAAISPHYGSPVAITAIGTLADGISRSLAKTEVPALETPITVILVPDGAEGKDAWAYKGYLNNNYGTTTEMVVDGGFWTSNFLIEFDLSAIPAGVTILAAELMLDLAGVDSADPAAAFTVFRMVEPWLEGTGDFYNSGDGATWNRSDGSTSWTWPDAYDFTKPIATTSVNPSYVGAHSWDITSLVQDWVSGSSANNGLVVTGNAQTHGAWFTSSDKPTAEKRPKLTITYACECGSEPGEVLALQPSGSLGEDTFIYSTQPDINFGTRAEILITQKVKLHHGLFRFDLSGLPAQAIIKDATLELNLESINSLNTGTVSVHRLTQDWKESQATWNDYGTGTPWAAAGGDYDPVPAAAADIDYSVPGPYPWDVTGLVIDWHTGTEPNYGMLLAVSSPVDEARFTSSDSASPGLRPKLTINYTCPCGVVCAGAGGTGKSLLFVVANPAAPTPQEQLRIDLIESWGYTVILIDDSDSQAAFDAAVAAVDVAYVSEQADAVELGTKLRPATIGVVIEEQTPDFGLAGDFSTKNRHEIDILDNTHYITSPYNLGLLTYLSNDQEATLLNSGFAPDLVTLGQTLNVGSIWKTGLAVIDPGGSLSGGGTAAGRRVQLPWGAAGFDIAKLNDVGQDIMKRSIEWGVGAGTGTGPGPTIVTLNPVADSFLDESAGSSNFGADTSMAAGKTNSQMLYRPLLQFDLSAIPPGSTVVSATLRLYVETNFGNKDKQIALHRVTAAWNENTVTWQNTGGGVFDPAQLAAPTYDKTTGWKEWDVPPGLLHEWLDGVTPNYGLLLSYISSEKNNYYYFSTREHADPTLRPQLVIEYNEP